MTENGEWGWMDYVLIVWCIVQWGIAAFNGGLLVHKAWLWWRCKCPFCGERCMDHELLCLHYEIDHGLRNGPDCCRRIEEEAPRSLPHAERAKITEAILHDDLNGVER